MLTYLIYAMQILPIYLFIGLILTMVVDEINNTPPFEEDDVELTDSDKVIYILLWPVILMYILYHLKK